MLFFLLSSFVLQAFSAWPVNVGTGNFAIKILLDRQEVPVIKNSRIVTYKTAYFGDVYVSSPVSQNFTALFDTGSAHMFLPSSACSDQACSVHRNYDRTRSSSAFDIDHSGEVIPVDGNTRDHVSISYGTGSVSGDFVSELVCVGAPAAHPVDPGDAHCTRVRLIQAHHMSTSPFADFAFDGVVGLSLESLALHRDFSFFGQLSRNAGIQPIFGVYLAGSPGDGAPAGEIVFGGHDAKRAQGPLQWVPVADPDKGYWQIRVLGLAVDSEPLDFCSAGDCVAIVDTGTSLLGVPRDHARTLNWKMARWAGQDAHEDPDLNCRSVPGPSVRLDLEGFSVELEAEDYSRPASVTIPPADGRPEPQVYCRASLLPVDMPMVGAKVFLLGEPVLRKYYTAFNARDHRIGFAPVAVAASSADPVAK